MEQNVIEQPPLTSEELYCLRYLIAKEPYLNLWKLSRLVNEKETEMFERYSGSKESFCAMMDRMKLIAFDHDLKEGYYCTSNFCNKSPLECTYLKCPMSIIIPEGLNNGI